jgi:hypothetical protein
VPTYVVDPTRFYAEGAQVDWVVVATRLGINFDANPPQRSVVELRWMLSPDLGMPTEPFRVWQRRHATGEGQGALKFSTRALMFRPGFSVVEWPEGSMSHVTVTLRATGDGWIAPFAGGPSLGNLGALTMVRAGPTVVQISVPVIDGLLLSSGIEVIRVSGIAVSALTQAAGWTLVETVGLPVVKADWNGIGRHGDPQGMIGALTDSRTAAVQRLQRGGPPIGWGPWLVAKTIAAPPWKPPDFSGLVAEINADLLRLLRDIVGRFPPNQQAAQQVTMVVPAPSNSSGAVMSTTGSAATLAPLPMTLLAAAGDPFLSLALGFGTAYPGEPPPATTGVVGRLDFMVTARWERGLSGASTAVEYAAIIPAPGPVLPPPPPANMTSTLIGRLRPLARDGNWRGSTRVSWDRPPDMQLFRASGFAFARADTAPPAAALALMEPRGSGGYRPIAINTPADPPDPDGWRLGAVDRELPILSNPGSRAVKYGAAVQDIYGQWTPWYATDFTLAQPEPDQVRLVSATLRPTPPASGSVCPATLEIEFLWDWRVRSPREIRFAGRLYATTEHAAPPPTTTAPNGLDRSLGGGGGLLVVTFAGDTPSAPGAVVTALDESGERQVAFGPAQGAEARRYRLSLSGLSLDFGTSGHIGLALWAQCQERIPPQRTGPWSTNPLVISASDPRPPVMPVMPVNHVTLASLPDAAGESHARITWGPQPGAVGYFIYESDETQILAAIGAREPAPDQTLDDRLKVLQNAFNQRAPALRRFFTRRNGTPLTGASADVSLPKGSTAIHLYVVLGISAGQVDSAWPAAGPQASGRMIAVAAPRVMIPAPPLLQVSRILDTTATPPVYKARVEITTRPGPRVKRVELHRVRVDDAARELDTMGPPVARITASGGGWNVKQAPDARYGPYIQYVEGIDAPPGSWRRVWYRATTWTARDDSRGGLPGRSPASTAAWLVLPPSTAPALSPLALGAGPTPADVILQWTSPAPVRRTPLGPHTLSARAVVAGAAAGAAPLLTVDAPLDRLGTSVPATGSGVWMAGGTPSLTTYRALVRRAALSQSFRFVARITDPLGRTGEALTTIAAGPVNPPPDLTLLSVVKLPGPTPQTTLQFQSSVPLVALLDGPYRVRVTVIREGPAFPPQPPAVVEMPVGSVPTDLAPSGVLALARLPGSGPRVTYVATTTLPVVRFLVRITAPDGQFVERPLSVA